MTSNDHVSYHGVALQSCVTSFFKSITSKPPQYKIQLLYDHTYNWSNDLSMIKKIRIYTNLHNFQFEYQIFVIDSTHFFKRRYGCSQHCQNFEIKYHWLEVRFFIFIIVFGMFRISLNAFSSFFFFCNFFSFIWIYLRNLDLNLIRIRLISLSIIKGSRIIHSFFD